MSKIKIYWTAYFISLVFLIFAFLGYEKIKTENSISETVEETCFTDFIIPYDLPDFPLNRNTFILEANKIYNLASRVIGESDLTKQTLMIEKLKRMIKNYNEYAKEIPVWDIPRPREFTLSYLLYK